MICLQKWCLSCWSAIKIISAHLFEEIGRQYGTQAAVDTACEILKLSLLQDGCPKYIKALTWIDDCVKKRREYSYPVFCKIPRMTHSSKGFYPKHERVSDEPGRPGGCTGHIFSRSDGTILGHLRTARYRLFESSYPRSLGFCKMEWLRRI